jgi:Uma2 family endonuclease
MTTWKRPDLERGLEADQCHYIRNEAIVRERDVLDLDVDPPPDLAIEVESSSLDRLEIYAGVRILEVWRHDGQKLTIHRLQRV